MSRSLKNKSQRGGSPIHVMGASARQRRRAERERRDREMTRLARSIAYPIYDATMRKASRRPPTSRVHTSDPYRNHRGQQRWRRATARIIGNRRNKEKIRQTFKNTVKLASQKADLERSAAAAGLSVEKYKQRILMNELYNEANTRKYANRKKSSNRRKSMTRRASALSRISE